MDEALVVLRQSVIMFLLMGVGVLLYKTKIVNESGSKQLSNLVINIGAPAVILLSYQMPYDTKYIRGLLWALALSLITYIVSILLSVVFIRNKQDRETAIERFCVVYSNCGFMGIPLIDEMFGQEGVFYVCAVITAFNIFVWTHGVMLVSGKLTMSSLLGAIKSPNIVAVIVGFACFFFRINIPHIPMKVIEHLAGINTPIAMLVIGMTIAAIPAKTILKNRRSAWISLLKLIVIPCVCAVVIRLFHAPPMVYSVVAITTACPTAGTVTMFALKYNKNASYSSQICAISTLASVITLPLVAMFSKLLI